MKCLPLAALAALVVLPAAVAAQSSEKLDRAMLAKIRDEGMQHSQVMDHVSWLADVYGPRLTGGPQIEQASAWAQKQFASWGLANIHEEPWPFGKGWSLVHFSAEMIEPQVQPLIGLPKSWTAGTPGPVTAEVVLAPIASEADFGTYRGKLRGKIVLTQPARDVKMLEGKIVLRMTDADLAEAKTVPLPAPARTARAAGGPPGAALQAKIAQFLQAKVSSRRSIAAPTASWRPAAAICPGRRSAPMAARSSSARAARATPRRGRASRR